MDAGDVGIRHLTHDDAFVDHDHGFHLDDLAAGGKHHPDPHIHPGVNAVTGLVDARGVKAALKLGGDAAYRLAVDGYLGAGTAEDLAAEQKARTTYDNILRLVKDPEVADPIRFLRQREIVHYQRFGESLRIVQDKLDSRNFYAFNPEFDK